ncbi:MAG: hypothetical protein H0X29_01555 [Parachlamydiaceae bacterium]|nr:hypothetical protein [Parachlamydiaceae bacterium]
MNKRHLNKLAILGITSGLIALTHTSANSSEAFQSEKINLNLLLAEHKCNGPHGCPGELNNTKNTQSLNSAAAKTFALIAEKEKEEGNLGYHEYSEDELLLELNDQGLATYNALDSEGKALARLVASQRCDHTNTCQGLNACQTEKNKCAGQGDCKGQGKCAFSDKNLAVKTVADKLAKKRAEASRK